MYKYFTSCCGFIKEFHLRSSICGALKLDSSCWLERQYNIGPLARTLSDFCTNLTCFYKVYTFKHSKSDQETE